MDFDAVRTRLANRAALNPNGCHIWRGRRNARGYGVLQLSGIQWLAHRLAWVAANRQAIPAGKIICHHCDVPACINPDHLFLGTKADNTADMHAKGRARPWGRHQVPRNRGDEFLEIADSIDRLSLDDLKAEMLSDPRG
jgi:hypothetical protein